MPGNYLFEYAVIRIVPRVEREEFINAGVILYCAKKRFLKLLYKTDEQRIRTLCEKINMDIIRDHLRAFESICNGDANGGPIARLPVAERFRWLTAVRSTMIQVSKVHPGFCDDPDDKIQQLFKQLVD